MIVCILGISGIIGLEAFAIHKGIDGAFFGAACGALGIIIGGWFSYLKYKVKLESKEAKER